MTSKDTHARSNKIILRKNSKTFAWATALLPKQVAWDVRALYAVCRSIDDFADELGQGMGQDSLMALRQEVRSNATIGLAGLVKDLRESCNLDVQALEHLIYGVELDLNHAYMETEEALIQYAYYVAGTVGLMMCNVMRVLDPAAQKHAIDLGIAMQLTNIARDIFEDAGMDRRYLPTTWLNLSPDAIRAPTETQRALIETATRRLLDLAEAYYQSGFSGLRYIPKHSRLGVAVAAKLYREIGQKIMRQGYAYTTKRTYVSVWHKIRISFITAVRLNIISAPRDDNPTLRRPLWAILDGSH